MHDAVDSLLLNDTDITLNIKSRKQASYYDDIDDDSAQNSTPSINFLLALVSFIFLVTIIFRLTFHVDAIVPVTSVAPHNDALAAWHNYSHWMAVTNGTNLTAPCVPYSTLSNECRIPLPDNNLVKNISLAMTVCGDGVLSVALTSLKSYYFHRHRSVQLTVYIVTDSPTNHSAWFNQSITSEWPESAYRHVHLVFIDITSLSANHSKYLGVFRPCATARLFLTELLPANVDSILYVDADTLALGDIRPVWAEFQVMNSYQSIAMSWESSGNTRSWYTHHVMDKFPWVRPYGVNSGVALMNLTRLRTKNFVDDMVAIMARDQETPLFELGDQDVLNCWIAGHQTDDVLHILPPSYNWRRDAGADSAGDDRGATILHLNNGCAFKKSSETCFHAYGFYKSIDKAWWRVQDV